MNKKGFTLIELLVIIALLAVIITIAVLSSSSISLSIKKSQYNNVVNKLKTAANKYFNDKGINKVFIETLINEGYIEGDDSKGKIYNPVTNEEINCYYFSLEGKDIVLTENDKCDEEIIKSSLLEIKYCDASNSKCTEKDIPNSWLNLSKIKLFPKFKDSSTNIADDAVVFWTSPEAPDEYVNGKYYEINESTKLVYQVTVMHEGKYYDASALVKLDNVEPKVTNLLVKNLNDWSPAKLMTFSITDEESGLKEYKVTTESTEPNNGWISADGTTKDIEVTIKENGVWYVWVKDAAGNVNQKQITNGNNEAKIDITKIDNVKPTCTYSGENTSWTNNNVTIYYGCEDNQSGCKTTGGSKTFKSSGKTGKIDSYTITDNAGNTKTCSSKTVNIYIDKSDPTISSVTLKSKEDYNTYDNVTLTVNFSDYYSGVSKICISEKDTCTSWKVVTGSSYNASYTFDTTYKNESQTKTLNVWVKDKAGNESAKKTNSYSIYQLCSSTVSYTKSEDSWSTCSKTCGGGTKYKDLYYKDTYFGSYCGMTENGKSQNCNTQDCCSSTIPGETTYGSCSTTCGTGTKLQNTPLYSAYNGQDCGSSSGTVACEDDSGCPPPEPEPEETPCGFYAGTYDSNDYSLYVFTYPQEDRCKIESKSTGSCTLVSSSTYGYWARLGKPNGECSLSVTYPNGSSASNFLGFSNGIGYYACGGSKCFL